MLTYLFPGQGSQYKGMGESLFNEFKETYQQANDHLGYCIKTLCLEDPEHKLNQTQFTQVALFVVNTLHYYKKLHAQPKIDFAAGHSLGEYNALMAANVFDFQTGLKLVQKRAELMQSAKDGGMAAIIGLNFEQVTKVLTENNFSNVSVANYNSYQQLVISGPKSAIKSLETIFSKHGNYIPLRVSGAFHTHYMSYAEEAFRDYLKNFSFNMPTIPVFSNYTATLHHPSVIKENLAKHISHPVRWTNIMECLLEEKNMTFEEIGPGNVLTKLLKNFK